MSDLSNLLGDVYGNTSPDEASVRRERSAQERTEERAPAWSSDQDLDRAFNGWVPGEAPSGDDRYREVPASELSSVPAPAPAPAAQTFAEVAPAPAPSGHWAAPINLRAPSPEPVFEMAHATAGPSWRPGDDDIVPSGKKIKNKKK
jgi:hypothetical protein